MRDFDLGELHAALDTRRAQRGTTWQAIAREIGVSASTLRGFATASGAEGDGVLRAVAWLDRSPESFVRGAARDAGVALRRVDASALRFDARALYIALDEERERRGCTWEAVARDIDASGPAPITHLQVGGRVTFPFAMRLLAWLDAPATLFVRRADHDTE